MPAAGPEQFSIAGAPALSGEAAGEGAPIVLCHGITATRRQVVHGSRALERSGRRVIAYDARGHGESDPAPEGGGYDYSDLTGDLARVVAELVGEGGHALAGHSMGAHTAIAYAIERPERVSALIVIGPVYDGEPIGERSRAYWDGLAEALEAGGVEGFVAYIDREQSTDPAWRDSVLRFTRERMLAHRHLGAVADALRQTPASRPFGSLEELESLEVPTLVVASGDAADPGHPRAVAEHYAERIPGARLVIEDEGASPLAWQGGRLSREIAAFCDAVESAESSE